MPDISKMPETRDLDHYYKTEYYAVSGRDIYPDKFQLYQIKNGPISAIIYFNMRDICQIAKTLSLNKISGFRERYMYALKI